MPSRQMGSFCFCFSFMAVLSFCLVLWTCAYLGYPVWFLESVSRAWPASSRCVFSVTSSKHFTHSTCWTYLGCWTKVDKGWSHIPDSLAGVDAIPVVWSLLAKRPDKRTRSGRGKMPGVSERQNPLSFAHQYSVIIFALLKKWVGGAFMTGCPLPQGKETMDMSLWLCL